jgi:putative ABC transport system ATP-binding protein
VLVVFTLVGVGVVRGGTGVLGEMSVEIRRGRLTVLTGPSGAGKTTLLRLLNRLDDPTHGQLLFDGLPIAEVDVLELRRRVVLVGQHPVLLTDTVASEVRVGHGDLTDDRARELLARVGLPAVSLDRATAGLSGGEAQRLCLARALAVSPEVLVLDEPTSHLDTASSAAIHAVLTGHRDAGGTVVVVSHDVDWIASAADSVLVLSAGRLVEHGSPRQVGYLEGTG